MAKHTLSLMPFKLLSLSLSISLSLFLFLRGSICLSFGRVTSFKIKSKSVFSGAASSARPTRVGRRPRRGQSVVHRRTCARQDLQRSSTGWIHWTTGCIWTATGPVTGRLLASIAMLCYIIRSNVARCGLDRLVIAWSHKGLSFADQ